MTELYDEDDYPFLYLDANGSLAIGSGYVLSELNSPGLEKLKKGLQRRSQQELEGDPTHLISDEELQRVMREEEMRLLLSALEALPFGGSIGEVVKGRGSTEGRVTIKRKVSLPTLEKKAMVKQTLAMLIRRSVILKIQLEKGERNFSPPTPADYYQTTLTPKMGSLILPPHLLESIQIDHHPTLGEEATSLVLDFTPFVGSVKSIAQVVKGQDLITKERLNRLWESTGVVLGLIPFGRLLLRSRRAKKLYLAVTKKPGSHHKLVRLKREEVVKERTDSLIEGDKRMFNFTGRIDSVVHRRKPSEIFVTDRPQIEEAIGPVGSDVKVIEITPEQARNLAQNLGIKPKITKYGGTLSVIDRTPRRNPTLPIKGRRLFKGPGKGLKRGGPEVLVAPISNTSTEPGIRQIDIKIKGLSNEKKKALAKEIIKKLNKVGQR